MAAKRLHLVDIGHLERQHCQHGNTENGSEIVPLESFDRDDVAAIDRGSDQHDQCELDKAHGAGEHDR